MLPVVEQPSPEPILLPPLPPKFNRPSPVAQVEVSSPTAIKFPAHSHRKSPLASTAYSLSASPPSHGSGVLTSYENAPSPSNRTLYETQTDNTSKIEHWAGTLDHQLTLLTQAVADISTKQKLIDADLRNQAISLPTQILSARQYSDDHWREIQTKLVPQIRSLQSNTARLDGNDGDVAIGSTDNTLHLLGTAVTTEGPLLLNKLATVRTDTTTALDLLLPAASGRLALTSDITAANDAAGTPENVAHQLIERDQSGNYAASVAKLQGVIVTTSTDLSTPTFSVSSTGTVTAQSLQLQQPLATSAGGTGLATTIPASSLLYASALNTWSASQVSSLSWDGTTFKAQALRVSPTLATADALAVTGTSCLSTLSTTGMASLASVAVTGTASLSTWSASGLGTANSITISGATSLQGPTVIGGRLRLSRLALGDGVSFPYSLDSTIPPIVSLTTTTAAARTITLPSNAPAGVVYWVGDESGLVSSGTPLTIAPASTDSLNAAAAGVGYALTAPRSFVLLLSSGPAPTNVQWTILASSHVNLGSKVMGVLGVTNGGTNLSSYTTNTLLYANAPGVLASSIGLSWNGATLAVTGSFMTSGLATLGSATVSGATSLATVSATGLAALASLTVTGDSTLSTLSTSLLATLNSASITTNLSVGGASNFATLTSSGLATLNSLQVPGTTTLASLTTSSQATLNSLTVSGLSSLTTLATSGLATLNSLSVSGSASLTSLSTSLAAVLNSASVTTTLGVTGSTTLSTLSTLGLATLNSLAVTGSTSITTLSTSGLATLASASVTTTLAVTGNTTVSTIASTGLATLNSISVSGLSSLAGSVVFGASFRLSRFALTDAVAFPFTITFPTTPHVVTLATTTASARSISLPAAPPSGTVYWIGDESGLVSSISPLTITPAASDTIDGAASGTGLVLTAPRSFVLLISGGPNPTNAAWSILAASNVSLSKVAGVLAVANGGTNLTSYTANTLLYASNTGTLASSNGLTWNGSALAVSGALSVTGATNLAALSTTGLASLNSLQVSTGASTLASLSTSALATLNSASITTTLAVTGATTVSTLSSSGLAALASLSVAGTSTLSSLSTSLAATLNSAAITTTLGVSGNTNLTTVTTSGLATLSSMTVSGPTFLGGPVRFSRIGLVNASFPYSIVIGTTPYIVAVATTSAATGTITLPAAAPAGTVYWIGDETGFVSTAFPLTIQPASGDSVDSASVNAGYALTVPRSFVLLASNGSTPVNWVVLATTAVNLATKVTGVLPATNGGTGLSAYTANTLLYANGTSSLASTTGLTWSGSALAVTGTVSTSGLATLNSVNVSTTLGVSGATTLTTLSASGLASLSAATITGASILAGPLRLSRLALNNINFPYTIAVATTPAIVVLATTTNAARTVTLPAIAPAGTVYWIGDEFGLLSASNTLTILSAINDTIDGTSGLVLSAPRAFVFLVSSGPNPTYANWSILSASHTNLATNVVGTLGVANGGTNLTSYTANTLLYATATNALASSTGLSWNGATLGITGALSASGSTTLNTLSTSGLTTLQSASVTTTLAVTGNTTLNTASTSGLATLASLSVTGASALAATTVSSTLGVSGITTLGVLNTTGLATLNSATITNALTLNGAFALSRLALTNVSFTAGNFAVQAKVTPTILALTQNPTAALTVTLPTAAAAGAGAAYRIGNELSTALSFSFSVRGSGTEQIDGSTSFDLTPIRSVVFVTSDGVSSWTVMGSTYSNLATRVTGVLAVPNGGTGVTTYAVGDLLTASSTSSLAKLPAGVTNGGLLFSNGSAAIAEYSGTGMTWNKTTNTLSPTNLVSSATTATTSVTTPLVTSGSGLLTLQQTTGALGPSRLLITNQATLSGAAIDTTSGTVDVSELQLRAITKATTLRNEMRPANINAANVTNGEVQLVFNATGTTVKGPVFGAAASSIPGALTSFDLTATNSITTPLITVTTKINVNEIAIIGNTSAPDPGSIGETITSTVLSTAPQTVASSTTTGTSITSVVLTPGQWMIHGSASLLSGNCNAIRLWTNTTNGGAIPDLAYVTGTTPTLNNGNAAGTSYWGGSIPTQVLMVVAGTATYYLNVRVTSGAATTWCGVLTATRIR